MSDTERTYEFGGVKYVVTESGPSSFYVDRDGVELSGVDRDTMRETVDAMIQYVCVDMDAQIRSLDEQINKLREKRQMLAAELQELYDAKGDPFHAWRT
jgi:hypothetical protein